MEFGPNLYKSVNWKTCWSYLTLDISRSYVDFRPFIQSVKPFLKAIPAQELPALLTPKLLYMYRRYFKQPLARKIKKSLDDVKQLAVCSCSC
jgi:hypothetical protein